MSKRLTESGKIIRKSKGLIVEETEEELEDRKKFLKGTNLFTDFGNKLKCTKCSMTQSHHVRKGTDLVLHPLLKVIYCLSCFDFYTDGEFSVDEDGEDKYCRWCGEGGKLLFCAKCICGFCAKCIRKNLGAKCLQVAEEDDDWSCLICHPKPIWSLRHIAHSANKEAAVQKAEKAKKSDQRRTRLKAKSDSLEASQDSQGSTSSGKSKIVDVSQDSQESVNSGKAKMVDDQDAVVSEKDKPVEGSHAVQKKDDEPAHASNNQNDAVENVEAKKESEREELLKRVKLNEEIAGEMKNSAAVALKDLKTLRIVGKFCTQAAERLLLDVSSVTDEKSLVKMQQKIVHLSRITGKMLGRLKNKGETPSTSTENEKKDAIDTEEKTENLDSKTSTDPSKEDDEAEKDKSEVEKMDVSETEEPQTAESTNPITEEPQDTPAEAEIPKTSECTTPINGEPEGTPVVSEVPKTSESNHPINKVEEHTEAEIPQSHNPDEEPEGKDLPSESECPEPVNKESEVEQPSESSKSAEEYAHTKEGENSKENLDENSDAETIIVNQSQDVFESEAQKSTGEKDGEAGKSSKTPIPDDISKNGDEKADSAEEVAASDSAAPKSEKVSPKKCLVIGSSTESDDAPKESGKEDVVELETEKVENTNDVEVVEVKTVSPKLTENKRGKSEKEPDIVPLDSDEEPLKNGDNGDSSDSVVQIEKKVTLTPRSKVKSRVLASSSEDEDQVPIKEEENKKIKDDVDALVNLNSLERSAKKKVAASSSAKKKQKDKKPKESEESLMDMLKELCSSSSEHEGENEESETVAKEENSMKTLIESEMSVLKNLVLGSGSSDEGGSDYGSATDVEIEQKKADKTPYTPKKRKRIASVESASSGDSQVVRNVKKSSRLKSLDDSSDSDIVITESKINGRKKRVKSSSSDSNTDTKKKRKRIIVSDSSDSSDSCLIVSQKSENSPRGRKNIRKLMKKDGLHVETKEAVKAEEKRKKRLAEREELFKKFFKDDPKRLILDFNDKGEVLLEVAPRIVKKLKPHQREGIKFMWDNCFESLSAMETSNGSGCILAHCMGLGKTLQVISLLHSVLTREVGVETALVICPMGTVSNWVHEFEMWMEAAHCDTIDVIEFNKFKSVQERRYQLKSWLEKGGVMITSYEMFRNMIKKAKKNAPELLLTKPGPDVVVCDEGHLLKNEDSILSKCVSQIQTARRIVLTGTPLQNNLREYHCMVQFIKPNILGSKKEFMNRFVNPIENGQFEDSTEYDVKIMKRRSHVLHKMLDGCIQRKDYTVLTPFLPEKHEYALEVALTEPLAKLYQYYLDNIAQRKATDGKRGGTLFNDFQALQRIWTHPLAMKAHFQASLERIEKANEEKEEDDFLDDGDESEASWNSKKSSSSAGSGEDSDWSASKSKKKKKEKEGGRRTRSNPAAVSVSDEPVVEGEKPWYNEMLDESLYQDEKVSGKIRVLFSILEECAEIGDKVLVFSQSLYSLDVIEHFLDIRNEAGERWELGINYFRLDGSTSSDRRAEWCKKFNRDTNKAAKLFLISTRAGGLGINMVGANRVVLFDASWNPSHDLQSIFRVFRFGQTKPCFIYRLLAEATMEEKIYERQVTKLSLAGRVVDEHQIERHYTMGNLQELYSFQPLPKEKWKTPIVPKDALLAKILKQHEDLIVNYHEHDSLLENKEEEELTEEERKKAWEEYENVQKKPPPPPSGFALAEERYRLYLAQMAANGLMSNPLFPGLSGMGNPLAGTQNPLAGMPNPFAGFANPLAGMLNPLANFPNPQQAHLPSILRKPSVASSAPSSSNSAMSQLGNLGQAADIWNSDLKQLAILGRMHNCLPAKGESLVKFRQRLMDVIRRGSSKPDDDIVVIP